MIHLDTNCLVDLHSPKSRIRTLLLAKLRDGERASCSTLVWAEYLCGPISAEERELSWRLIEASPVPLDEFAAELGAQFFNSTGRRRGSLALRSSACKLGNPA
jgi:predicted nucleic acid-binding protein